MLNLLCIYILYYEALRISYTNLVLNRVVTYKYLDLHNIITQFISNLYIDNVR